MTEDAPEEKLPSEQNSQSDATSRSFSIPTDDLAPNKNSFTSVGQLIRRRTTDFLAIAILGFGLFAISGHLVDWWRTDSDELTRPLLTAEEMVGLQSMWGSDGSPVTLDLGDSPYSVRKHFIRGKAEAAVEYLVTESQAIATRPLPDLPPATAAETRLIKLINNVKPVVSGDSWAIYRIDYPSIMVVGVRASEHAEDANVRVVCWGIMLSVGDQWSLFMIEPAATGTEQNNPFVVSLPPNSKRTMSLRDERGASVIGVTGKSDIRSWAKHYAEEFSSNEWSLENEWRYEKTQATARYAIESSGRKSHWIDVQLTRTANQRCSGLIVITPLLAAEANQK